MSWDWSLDALYTGFETDAFQRDFAAISQKIEELRAAYDAAPNMEPAARVEALLCAVEALRAAVRPPLTYAELRISKNTADTEAVSWSGRIESLLAANAGLSAAVERCIALTPGLDEVAGSSEYLQQYRHYLAVIARRSKYMLDDSGEDMAARLNLSGAKLWVRQFDALTSSVRAQMDGKEYTLPQIRNFATSGDAALRKAAYEAELACYRQIEAPIAFSLNGVKKQANTMATLRGFDSVIDMTLKKTGMRRETLDAMWGAIERRLPVFWGYLRAKAKLLGHEGGLPWYDLFAPVGSLDAQFTPESCRDYLCDVFSGFTPRLSDMIRRAFDEGWIDMYPAPGKVGGAFCDSLTWLRQSRILTNFNGTFDAVVTLAHELGHAWHGQQMADNAPLNRSCNMQLAETASTFNEILFVDSVLRRTDDPAAQLAVLENILSGNTQVMCDIYSRYTFESEVVARCPQEELSAGALKDIMLRAQQKAYGDGLDHELLHPYMWACKSHYYIDSLDFYNFPYAFGALFSLGLYRLYRERGDAFIDEYCALLRNTGVMDTEDVAATVGADITREEFWDSSLEQLAEYARRYEELATALTQG